MHLRFVLVPFTRSRPGWLRRCGAALLLLAGVHLLAAAQSHQPPAGVQEGPIRFGILPLGGVFESRNDWEPLLADLARTINRPVSVLSVSSYDALDQAIRKNQVDMAFLSGRMALDAVTQHGMTVVAQVTRHDGLPGYRSLLLVRKGGQVTTLESVLGQPERLRLARGESKSVSGFIVPQLQLFLPNHIAMETRFKSEFIGTHQATALAVANGEADVATNNTADLERFKLQFPSEFERLIIVWQSDLIPHAQIVMRREYPPEFQKKVQAFLANYGRTPGPRGDPERAVLRSLHDLAGFLPADNSSLLPAARLAHQLAHQSAMNSQWVNEEARASRLAKVDAEYAQQAAVLRGAASPP
ncbi:phosphate/phosphite/phosphonate ABC transporter substrate-binding protein [Variovorax sp. OV329]|uniref:phosphate/phosphite/phosphonate ABC transporter substrate-binding protein n=1 Tax=Variovorax sp. OV329 TaxID=1882825 RepID=UPI0008EFA264|nr:phosphate/phosphite/phosphonate ABC transporter substrate-binding protein [Variovorax sp. OV329]SFM81617.1 phosphonate transport system substrate-binding protein [Variovorax sp. OV329]